MTEREIKGYELGVRCNLRICEAIMFAIFHTFNEDVLQGSFTDIEKNRIYKTKEKMDDLNETKLKELEILLLKGKPEMDELLGYEVGKYCAFEFFEVLLKRQSSNIQTTY